jgi:hypothetical protein
MLVGEHLRRATHREVAYLGSDQPHAEQQANRRVVVGRLFVFAVVAESAGRKEANRTLTRK